MRVQLATDDLAGRVELITRTARNGRTYRGVRFHATSVAGLGHQADPADWQGLTLWYQPATRAEGALLADVLELALQLVLADLSATAATTGDATPTP